MNTEKLSNENETKALNKHSVMQGLPTENEVSAMAILTMNLEDSDTAKIIHRAAFEAGARWVISELSGSPAVGQRSVGTVAEAQALTHGICKERNCNEPATKDYNGHEHCGCHLLAPA